MYKMLSAQGMHINYCDDVWPTLLYQVLFTMTPFLPIMNVDISHIRDFVFKLSLLPPPKKKPAMATTDGIVRPELKWQLNPGRRLASAGAAAETSPRRATVATAAT